MKKYSILIDEDELSFAERHEFTSAMIILEKMQQDGKLQIAIAKTAVPKVRSDRKELDERSLQPQAALVFKALRSMTTGGTASQIAQHAGIAGNSARAQLHVLQHRGLARSHASTHKGRGRQAMIWVAAEVTTT